MADAIDTASPEMCQAIGRCCLVVAGILDQCADDMAGFARATPWQCLRVMARLGRIADDVEFLKKEIDKLVPAQGDDDG